MAQNNILLFGGSFDPIHHGHLIVARAVAEAIGAERVMLIPAAQPPHKLGLKMTAPDHRLHMARLAVEEDDLFEVSDCELHRQGPSYTIDTVRHFRTRFAEGQLFWLIGADSVADLPTWRSIGALADECTLVTAVRPGFSVDWSVLKEVLNDTQIKKLADYQLPTPQIDISATQIRRRVQTGLPICYLTPPAVVDYIFQNRLYL